MMVSFSSFIVVNIDGRNYVNFGEAQRFLVNFDGELTELTSILTGLSHDWNVDIISESDTFNRFKCTLFWKMFVATIFVAYYVLLVIVGFFATYDRIAVDFCDLLRLSPLTRRLVRCRRTRLRIFIVYHTSECGWLKDCTCMSHASCCGSVNMRHSYLSCGV